MNFLYLATSFEASLLLEDRAAIRERARLEALRRLAGTPSLFDTMTSEQAAAALNSTAPATAGHYDPAVTTYEAAE
jgi:hypothetical protein